MHKVRVSTEEEALLQKTSQEHGVTVSALLAEAALDISRVHWRRVWTNELMGLRRQLKEFPPTEDLLETNRKINVLLEELST